MKHQKVLYGLIAAVILAVWCWPSTVLALDPKTDLQLYVSGGFSGTLTAGQETRLLLVVKNNGDTTLDNITFQYDAQDGTLVSFQPDSIARLSAGNSTTVSVIFTTGKKSGSRDEHINLIASSSQATAITTVYYRVSGGYSYWTYVGLALGVLAVTGFILVYRRFSK